MTDAAFDPAAMLAELERAGVEYLVIGGIAAAIHGGTRLTQDLDIVPEPGRENAERLATALRRLHARLKGVDAHLLPIDPTDPDDLATGANFTLETDLGDLDVLVEPEGMGDWHEIAARAVRLDLGAGAPVRVIGVDDLIALKRIAGRRQDVEDIVELTAGRAAAERPARSRVLLRVPIAEGVGDAEALDAADIVLGAFEREVRVRIVREGDARTLELDGTLERFSAAHAETWASITEAKLAGLGIAAGPARREIEEA